MKLTSEALEAIKDQRIRIKLATALNCTEQWIIKLISKNKDNGSLTKVQALRVIMRETKLKQSEILTETIEA